MLLVLRVLIGKSEPANCDDLESLPRTWQLVLCSPSVFEALKAKKKGNWVPQELDAFEKPISFVETRVVLCIWGKGHLSVLSESSVKPLVSVINKSIIFGTHGCTLTWGKQAWQLDSGLQTVSGDPGRMLSRLESPSKL
jgi:hypothetical protein